MKYEKRKPYSEFIANQQIAYGAADRRQQMWCYSDINDLEAYYDSIEVDIVEQIIPQVTRGR